MTELKLPDVGDNIEKGTVVALLVAAGDQITEGQAIIEIETDKAVVEVPASAAGTVKELKVKVGDTLAIGSTIALLEDGLTEQAEQPAEQQAEKPAEPASPASSETVVTLPDVGDNIEKGTVVALLVAVGDQITEGQAIIEIETDKAVVEVPASAAGTVKELKVKVGDSVQIGGALLLVASEGASSAVASSAQPAEKEKAAPVVSETPTWNGRATVPAAPSIRRLGRELGVDLSTVKGSGPAGRITEEDVRRAQSGEKATEKVSVTPAVTTPSAAPVAPTLTAAPLPDFSKWGHITREDMSGIRKATVRSMTASTAIPMVTHFDKADITVMEETRKRFAARVEKAGGKLTMTHILMKVVANALRQFPKFGASLDLAAEQVIYKDYVNIGVAVDTPVGLLVPVIKNADQKSITEMVRELSDLAARARDRKLKPDEMQGATFTISNLGGIGGHAFTPIVNSPEVAILGVSRGGFEPVWNKEKGEFEPRNMLPISLSYDHRLIDGADAARFVRFICESLEDPFLISL